jgi:NDP-sugar pyrophosphorylase family protein
MQNVTVLVLAGGAGTRLAGLYPDLPKALVPVAGEPFLHWLVSWLRGERAQDFVFSLGHRGDQIEGWLRQAPAMSGTRWQAFQETEPLGTGGGVRACLSLCEQENMLVINGDGLLLSPLRPLGELFAAEKADGVLTGIFSANTSRSGTLVVDDANRLMAFREKQPGEGLINAGTYLFRKAALESFPQNGNLSMEYDVIPQLLAQGKRLAVHKIAADTPFIDIGTPAAITAADDFVRRHLLQAA